MREVAPHDPGRTGSVAWDETENGPTRAKPVFEGTKGRGEQIHALHVRDRAVPRRPGRRAGRLGLGPGLDATSCCSLGLLHRRRATASRSATTGYSPTARSRRTGRCGSRWRSPGRWPSRARSIRWVADHRRHHAFSDREGDPHSPWRYGNSIGALHQGLLASRTSAGCSTSSTPTARSTRPTCCATATSSGSRRPVLALDGDLAAAARRCSAG